MASKKSSAAFLTLVIGAIAVALIILYGASTTVNKQAEDAFKIRTEFRADNTRSRSTLNRNVIAAVLHDASHEEISNNDWTQNPAKPTVELKQRKGITKKMLQNDEAVGFVSRSREKIEVSKEDAVDQRPVSTSVPLVVDNLAREEILIQPSHEPDSEQEFHQMDSAAPPVIWDQPLPHSVWTESFEDLMPRFPEENTKTKGGEEVVEGEINDQRFSSVTTYLLLQRLFDAITHSDVSGGTPSLEFPPDQSGHSSQSVVEVVDSISKPDEPTGQHVEDSLILSLGLALPKINRTTWDNFLDSLNGTIRRDSASSEILKHLNKFYKPSSSGAELVFGRNAYEKSLTAFVFMTFGIFLLKQINVVSEQEGNDLLGRNQRAITTPYASQPSDLAMLFDSPVMNWTIRLNAAKEKVASNEGSSTMLLTNENGSLGSSYLNNLFRGVGNLVNAYTKDTYVLECIWSLYCQELDSASAKDGLYGIAARINSIGLRLIMDQIPAELTFDVLLRSLLGWDGLPCTEMFPKCHGLKAKLALQAATSANSI